MPGVALLAVAQLAWQKLSATCPWFCILRLRASALHRGARGILHPHATYVADHFVTD